ncbi:MAG: hypothetical protein WDA18_04005 [Candidatus Ratteibacteria bacterium]
MHRQIESQSISFIKALFSFSVIQLRSFSTSFIFFHSFQIFRTSILLPFYTFPQTKLLFSHGITATTLKYGMSSERFSLKNIFSHNMTCFTGDSMVIEMKRVVAKRDYLLNLRNRKSSFLSHNNHSAEK